MPKIRKQPKRSTKKVRISSLKNPFKQLLSHIPADIAKNIRALDTIIPEHLD